MPRYNVVMLVEFAGEIEADSQEEAERLAIYDSTVFYEGVDSIEIDEIEEEDEEDAQDETDDAYALASAGFGTDEDY